MRYFLHTEFNGHQGELISIALVSEDLHREIYVKVPTKVDNLLTPWAAKHVIPALYGTSPYPTEPKSPVQRRTAGMMIGMFLGDDPEPMVLASRPVDIAHLCNLLVLEDGKNFPIPALQMIYFAIGDFNHERDSKVPFNALWDARALADHVLAVEEG